MKLVTLFLVATALLAAGWWYCDYYVFTIKVHVPVFGYVDTGISKSELDRFEEAKAEYDQMEKDVRDRYYRGEITEEEKYEQLNSINAAVFADPRVTAITGTPAKKFLKFLLDKM